MPLPDGSVQRNKRSWRTDDDLDAAMNERDSDKEEEEDLEWRQCMVVRGMTLPKVHPLAMIYPE